MTDKTTTPPGDKSPEWHSLSLDDTLKRLAVQEQGLSREEARRRLDAVRPEPADRRARPFPLQAVGPA